MKCPKCKAKMKFIRTEWGDDNKGNCGNVDIYKCLRCNHEEYKTPPGDDGFSYHPG